MAVVSKYIENLLQINFIYYRFPFCLRLKRPRVVESEFNVMISHLLLPAVLLLYRPNHGEGA